jgi:hypothetical protein
MTDWPYCFGPVARQHIKEGTRGKAKLLTLWAGSKREADEGTRILKSPLKPCPPVTEGPSRRPHLLKDSTFPNSTTLGSKS